ncbi:MAG: hypothetical protein JNJ81_01810 [Candidatus Accumulibacter sp.]|nr:hypothetical protein [Accumulibacter sp.]
MGWTSTSAAAILAAKPSLARDSFELGDRLESEFSSRGDIDQDDFLRFFHEAICQGGEAPVFLLVLDELIDKDRLLMRVAMGGCQEYRLQTRESADWFVYQRAEEDALRSEPAAFESRIREQLIQLAGEQIRKLAIAQGASREIRRLKAHTDSVTAPKAESDVPVWLRSDLDGTQAREVLADAARAGINSAIVFAHVALPRKDELVRAVITQAAAERTLGHFGEPQTPEGQEARNALSKQKADADQRAGTLLREALEQAQVSRAAARSWSRACSRSRYPAASCVRKRISRRGWRRCAAPSWRSSPMARCSCRVLSCNATSHLL